MLSMKSLSPSQSILAGISFPNTEQGKRMKEAIKYMQDISGAVPSSLTE